MIKNKATLESPLYNMSTPRRFFKEVRGLKDFVGHTNKSLKY